MTEPATPTAARCGCFARCRDSVHSFAKERAVKARAFAHIVRQVPHRALGELPIIHVGMLVVALDFFGYGMRTLLSIILPDVRLIQALAALAVALFLGLFVLWYLHPSTAKTMLSTAIVRPAPIEPRTPKQLPTPRTRSRPPSPAPHSVAITVKDEPPILRWDSNGRPRSFPPPSSSSEDDD